MTSQEPLPWKFEKNVYQRTEKITENETDALQYSWINHSTFLFQYKKFNILTDPIWSKRCSPLQWAGPARKRLPGVLFDALPRIDLVLVSHNHYDHLDIPTLKRLISL